MHEALRLLLGLVELAAIAGAATFLVYGHGRWWA